jgi:hypothetical protein
MAVASTDKRNHLFSSLALGALAVSLLMHLGPFLAPFDCREFLSHLSLLDWQLGAGYIAVDPGAAVTYIAHVSGAALLP